MALELDARTVTADTNFRGSFFRLLRVTLPNLGAAGDCRYRIYLLRCRGQITGGSFCWYVGLAEVSTIRGKLVGHFARTEADYTATNEPLSIELVAPCPSPAAEAYLFAAMLEVLPCNAVKEGRLGGWTQTRPKPSQLSQVLLQDAWRMVRGRSLSAVESSVWRCQFPTVAAHSWPASI